MRNSNYWKIRKFEKASIFTVASLIEELKKYPEDAEVYITGTADCHHISAGGHYIQPVLSENGEFLQLFNDEDWDFYHGEEDQWLEDEDDEGEYEEE